MQQFVYSLQANERLGETAAVTQSYSTITHSQSNKRIESHTASHSMGHLHNWWNDWWGRWIVVMTPSFNIHNQPHNTQQLSLLSSRPTGDDKAQGREKKYSFARCVTKFFFNLPSSYPMVGCQIFESSIWQAGSPNPGKVY